MLKRLLLSVALAFWASSSYSDSIAPYYGTTGNAVADSALRWSMGNVLPEPPGLDINGVIYNYTINKDVDDRVDVHVQNENALGTGYTFRETDRWMPGSLSGTEINKVVPVLPGIPRAAWGDGSIEVEGNGSVSDPSVRYTYKVDPCFDPQYDPNCPGYKMPTVDVPTYELDLTSLYDMGQDVDYDRNLSAEERERLEDEDEDQKSEEELSEEEEAEKEERAMRLEKALAEADNSAMFAQSLAQAQILAAANAVTNISSYYSTNIPGGTYKENVVLVDKELPNNKRGLRNGLAQQLLHEEMIEMQYDR